MGHYEIPAEFVAEQIEKRGDAHPWKRIPAERTAFVVIDMQNYFVESPAEAAPSAAASAVPSINRMARALRDKGGKVIWIQNTTAGTSESWSVRHELLSPERALYRLKAMEPDSEGFKLWPTLEALPEDVIIIKKLYSAFAPNSSPLPAYLRDEGIDFVLIGGTYTDCCSLVSAQDAMMANFRTIMVSDCNGGSSAEMHAAALNIFYKFFGDVLSTDEVISRLQPVASYSSKLNEWSDKSSLLQNA
jgi:ureidoacrylate peracid hydrolase